MQQRPGEDTRLLHVVADLNGAPRESIDSQGQLAWGGQLDTWGRLQRALVQDNGARAPGYRDGDHGGWQPAANDPAIDIDLRQANQWADEESGLLYNLNRHYDPDVGQYASQDPLGPIEGGLRTQGYVHNPATWVDPLGLNGCQGTGRSGALNKAKRDLDIPRSQHPDAIRRVPMTDRYGRNILGSDGKPIITREYYYTQPDGSTVVLQDHAAGHQFGEGGVGDQGPHFNVRPSENTRTGSVLGAEDHYPW